MPQLCGISPTFGWVGEGHKSLTQWGYSVGIGIAQSYVLFMAAHWTMGIHPSELMTKARIGTGRFCFIRLQFDHSSIAG